MKRPMFVVGAVDTFSIRTYFSQGTDGDGILTVSAPGKDVKLAEAYTADYTWDEGTSFGEHLSHLSWNSKELGGLIRSPAAPKVTASVAYFMALRGPANTPMNQYVYDLISGPQGFAYSRVRNGPKVLSNGVPAVAFGQCRASVNQKRALDDGSEDSCSLAPQSSSSTRTFSSISGSSGSQIGTSLSTLRTIVSATEPILSSPNPSSQTAPQDPSTPSVTDALPESCTIVP